MVDRVAQLAYPVVFVLSDQADTPGQRLAPAAGDAAVDQGVEDLPLLQPKPGHGRRVDRGEPSLGVAAHGGPAHRASKHPLGVVGDCHALFPGGLAEGDDLLLGAQSRAGGPEVAGDEDLVGVVADVHDVGEPSVGQRLGEPGDESLGVGDRSRGGPLAPGS